MFLGMTSGVQAPAVSLPTPRPLGGSGGSHIRAPPLAAHFLYLQGDLFTDTISPFLLTLPILRVRAENEMSQGLEHKI